MKSNACLEAQSAWAMWREQNRSERTAERLEAYVRHWCEVYARNEAYTQLALEQARELAQPILRLARPKTPP
jgi:hypothetical protein